MTSTRAPRRPPSAAVLTTAAVAGPCVAAVVIWGELSLAALVTVAGAGTVVAGLGVVRRAGDTAPPVGRRGLPWLGWLAAAGCWELVALAHDGLPTVSDLADPLLAHPVVRGAAAVCWLVAGAWLISRPRRLRPG